MVTYPTNNTPQKRFPWAWNLARLGVLSLPLIPALGEAGLILALLLVWQQQYRQIVKQPINWGVAILTLWLVANSCWAAAPQEAFLGLANFFPFFALFAAFSVLIEKPSQLRQLAWLMAIPSLPIVILGFGQLAWGWSSPKLFIGWTLVAHGEPAGRMSAVFMYANILAAYLLIVFILGLGLWLDTYQIWRKGVEKHASLALGFLTVTLIANGLGLILTSSRNAWGLAFLGCLAFILYLGWRWLVLGLVAAAGSVLWASFGPSPGREGLRRIIPAYFWARLSDEMYPDRPIATLRATQWEFAWNMVKQRPWMGWGLRNFTPLYQAQMGIWLGHPHNLFLMLMAETGIPATILSISIVGWIVGQASLLLKIWSAPSQEKSNPQLQRDRLILFTYLVAFGGCTLFNLFDVTIFDLRVNTLGWLLLSAIGGIVHHLTFPVIFSWRF